MNRARCTVAVAIHCGAVTAGVLSGPERPVLGGLRFAFEERKNGLGYSLPPAVSTVQEPGWLQNYGHLGCSVDVLFYLDAACSGLRSCELSVSDPALVRTRPCPPDFASYLDASYRCVPGMHECFTTVASVGFLKQSSAPIHPCCWGRMWPKGEVFGGGR